jgi:hypothetical protein
MRDFLLGFALISAIEEDFEEAKKLWEKIAESQEHNLPPYVYDLYKEVIVPAFREKNAKKSSQRRIGVTRNEILKKHYDVYDRNLAKWQLRQEILPMLETVGLIVMEPDPRDRRSTLVKPSK